VLIAVGTQQSHPGKAFSQQLAGLIHRDIINDGYSRVATGSGQVTRTAARGDDRQHAGVAVSGAFAI
jgi:hypothetical protein